MAGAAEEWWDAQRERAAPTQLSLQTAPAPTASFEYLSMSQMDLSSTTAGHAMPNGLGDVIVIEGGGPAELTAELPEQPPLFGDVLPQQKARAPAHKGPPIRAPHKGAVAQRLHPHHPFHTEPSTIHAAPQPPSLPIGSSETAPASGASFLELFGPKAWRRTAAPVAAMDGGTPISPPALPPSAPPPRTERSVQDGVGLSQAPVPSKIRMERSTRGGLDRARTPAPADGGVYVDPIRALAKPSRMAAITEAVRPGVKRPTQPKPMWSAKASQPGLFDHTLGSRALRDDELQARLGRQARGGAASHGADGLRDIEEQFHRVRCRDNWVHSGSRMSNVRVLNSRGSCNSACSTLAIVVCFCELAIPYNLVHRIPAVVEDRIPAYHQIAYQSVLYDLGVGPRATWPRFWGTGRRH